MKQVPPEKIVNINIYSLDEIDSNFLIAWKKLQDSVPYSIVWTPQNGGHWIALRGSDIAKIYRDGRRYSSHCTLVPRDYADAYRIKPTNLDPPEHTPYRRIIANCITTEMIEKSKPVISELMNEVIDNVISNGQCEYISEISGRLPVLVFLHLANLPLSDIEGLPPYSPKLIHEDGSRTDMHVMNDYAEYLRPHCRARRNSPGHDLLSRVVCGKVENKLVSETEAVEMATTMMTGGLDTITSTLGLLMGFLAEYHQMRRRFVAEPALLERAIPELLRRFPTMTKARLVMEDHELDGMPISSGDMIVAPPLHGLDDRIWSDPLTVDLERPHRPNLTFGSGPHRCPGMRLAIAEISAALSVWLRRIPEFEFDAERPFLTSAGILGAVKQLGLKWNI